MNVTITFYTGQNLANMRSEDIHHLYFSNFHFCESGIRNKLCQIINFYVMCLNKGRKRIGSNEPFDGTLYLHTSNVSTDNKHNIKNHVANLLYPETPDTIFYSNEYLSELSKGRFTAVMQKILTNAYININYT